MYEIIIKKDGKLWHEQECDAAQLNQIGDILESQALKARIEKRERFKSWIVKQLNDGRIDKDEIRAMEAHTPMIPGKTIVGVNQFAGGTVPVVKQCEDCKGTGRYQPFNGPEESCRACCAVAYSGS